jgi:hypothetical protein
MFPAIIFGAALLCSWWAINAFITVNRLDKYISTKVLSIGEKKAIHKRIEDKVNYSLILDVAATVLWIMFYYVTH